MITGGFGVSVFIGEDGDSRTRQWYVRADGVKRWADNDQPCEPQASSKPVCAVNGAPNGRYCPRVFVFDIRRCLSNEYCEHQREGK